MIMDTAGAPIVIMTESQLGVYEARKETAVYMIRRSDNTCFIRLKDGSEFTTRSQDRVTELPK